MERAEGLDLAERRKESGGMREPRLVKDVIANDPAQMVRDLATASAQHSKEKRINAMTATIEVHVPARLLDAANEAFVPFETAHTAINAGSTGTESRVVVRAIKCDDIDDLEFHFPMGFIWKRNAEAKD